MDFRHRSQWMRSAASRTLLSFAMLGTLAAAAADSPPAVGPTREIFELSSLRPQLETVGLQLDELVSAQVNFRPEALDVIRIAIAKHGKVVAILAPPPGAPDTSVDQAIRSIHGFRAEHSLGRGLTARILIEGGPR